MRNFKIGKITYTFLPNCRGGRGSNRMHQGGNYEDFLKWDGGDCFRSFSYDN